MDVRDKRFLRGLPGQGMPFSTPPPGALPHPTGTSARVRMLGLDVGGLERVAAWTQGGRG